MFEDGGEKTTTIADQLREQGFIQGIEKGRLEGREEVARNLLLQGLVISVIESAPGLSRDDLATLQKSIKITL
jgi:predicted transposase YdaD